MRYTGGMFPLLINALAWVNRVCGFDTLDSFPPGHAYARTHWNKAYFDIASDLKPEQIERSLCESISNTPSIFAHIANPTPRMQRALLNVIEARMRRQPGAPADLITLLVNAYRSPYTIEVIPGLRAAIEGSEEITRVHAVLAFLDARYYDVIEA